MMGTLIGIGGAMILTFYKGAAIDIWSTHVDLLHHNQPHGGHVASTHGGHVVGSFLAIASCFSYAFWLIIQVIFSTR